MLRKDANACESLPPGEYDKGICAGDVCPHHVYHHKASIFENRDGVSDTIERLFRLVNAAEVGIISVSDLTVFDVTELLTARGELDRQGEMRRQRDYERSKLESQANQRG